MRASHFHNAGVLKSRLAAAAMATLFAALALAVCAFPTGQAHAADGGPLGAARLVIAGAANPQASANIESVTFFNVSGATLEAAGCDDMTVGSADSTLVPEENVLYLPASADIAALRFKVNYYDLGAGLSLPPVLGADYPPMGTVITQDEGVLDLSSLTPCTDEAGRAYWQLSFAPPGSLTVAYVRVYWDGSSSSTSGGRIAAMYLCTTNGLDWIEQDKGNRDPGGSIAIVGPDGAVQHEGALAEMKGRGHSSWNCAKKPYQIKLGKKAELVEGAGAAKTWVLLANAYDPSFVRESAAMDIAAQAGLADTPVSRQVSLYVDGSYRGVYLLIEKVQVNGERIDIRNLEDANEDENASADASAMQLTLVTDTAGTEFEGLSYVSFVSGMESPADVTGGYLLEMEIESRLADETSYFKTSRGTCFVIKNPERASREEAAYIANYMQQLEDAIYAEDGVNDLGKRYADYIDVESLASYYAVQEVIGNHDAFKSSTFFYKDSDGSESGGIMHVGPLWDCDRTIGGVKLDLISYEDPRDILVADPNRRGARPQWICEFMRHADFQALVKDAYASKVYPAAKAMADTGISNLAAGIALAQALDNVRWSGSRSRGETPYGGNIVADVGDFAAATATARDYLSTRADALSGKIGVPIAKAVDDGNGARGESSASSGGGSASGGAGSPGAGAAVSGESKPAHFTRLAGADRYATMAAVNKAAFAAGSSPVAIVASGASFPDALCGASLAGLLDCPIVTTAAASLSPEAASELKRLGVKRAYIIGGSAAVSSGVEASVRALGVDTTRLAGADRYATCLAVYREGVRVGSWSNTCIVASGATFPDALSVGPYAFASRSPVFLACDGLLGPDALAAVNGGGFSGVVVVGGNNAVNYGVLVSRLTGRANITQLAGETRYDTSWAIAQWEMGLSPSAAVQPSGSTVFSCEGMAIASGRDYPDALVASTLLGKSRSALQLVDDSETSRKYASLYLQRFGLTIGEAHAIGGVNAVSNQVLSWFQYK